MLPIRLYPDKVLSKKCITVGDKDNPESPIFGSQQLNTFIDEMKMTMISNNGQGLAAPQVNWPICVITCFVSDDEPSVFINPRIKEFGGKQIKTNEGCLSIPGINASLSCRYERIHLEYEDVEGGTRDLMLTGQGAIAVQHEIDHLDGKTFFQRMGSAQRELKRNRYLKWVKKSQKQIKNTLKQNSQH